jgi:uncharacterized repeat protein (TIGR01451 family)
MLGLGALLTAGIAAPAKADNPPIEVVSPAVSGEDSKEAGPGGFPPGLTRPGRSPLGVLGTALGIEVEPNDTAATATAIAGVSRVMEGKVFPNADVDYYAFNPAAGDRVYAAVMTSYSASASPDSVLDLIAGDGTTVLETDLDDGSFGTTSSTISGATIASAGTHYLRVRHNVATGQLRPYRLFFQLRSGAPVAETESNDTFPGQPLPGGGWVTGSTGAATDVDYYAVSLAAGDTLFLSLDLDPERDATEWNGQLGLGAFGTPATTLVANDAGTATPDSEAFFMTVKAAGTYGILVGLPTGGTNFGTYHLSATVFPHTPETTNCTTYTSTNVPAAIPTGPGLVTSTLTVPGSPTIADLDVSLDLTHTFIADLDVELTAPGGNTVGLFTDVGPATAGGSQVTLDTTIDQEAGIPIGSFTIVQGESFTPELAYRLSWFDGQPAGGTWTLTLRDDATGDGGTLNAWSITVCEPLPPPSCAPGFAPTTVFTTDFESSDAGFTHSGTGDEWERGTPAFTPITTCNSGANCFKTDLDNTYNASSSQDLLSPSINLAGLTAPVLVSWAQKYHLESANFDHALVEAREVGVPANAVRLFDWDGATMNNTVGNPTVTVAEAAGWGVFTAQIDSLAGLDTELRFHLDADTTVQLSGLAIDDITVTACRPVTADLAITKTDGVATAVPGGSVTYTITASNAGPEGVTGGTVADTFPATCAAVSWTCVGAGGGTCTAGPVAGNINDAVDLPAGGSVTYTATCTISSAATGALSNTATVSGGATPDPDPANNSATDTDTLVPQADLAISKDDGTATAVPGQSTTYTIVASNPGPSDAPGSSVADTFPALCTTVSWTCAGAGGGTCTAGPIAGNIADTVNLPAGGSVTYTAVCTIGAGATGLLANTATVANGTVADANPANNSATDTDTLAPQADLAITKTDGAATAVPGQTTTYTIVASNPGPSDAPGTAIADTFPAVCTGVIWTCAGAGGGTCTAGPVSGNIADTANLPAGGSVSYSAVCTIAAGASGTLANTATVTNGVVTDPDAGNNAATDTDTLAPQADLAITKNDGVASVIPGNAVTYTIVASNPGPSDAPGTAIADTFPAACASVTWSCVGSGGGTCNAGPVAGNIADTANLPVGGSVTYAATCTVNPAASGTLDNTATVTGTGVTDPNAANNAATDSDVITQGPFLSATKQVSGTVFLTGSAVTYTVVITNTGGTTQPDNPGDEFVDVLPAELQLVSAAATSGTVVATVATRTVTWNGALAPAESVTITIAATLLPTAPGATVSNQGTVSFDTDANGTNESTGVTDDPTVGGSSDPTEFQSQGNQEIPTLSTIGLLALMAALAFAAVTVLRRSEDMTAAP